MTNTCLQPSVYMLTHALSSAYFPFSLHQGFTSNHHIRSSLVSVMVLGVGVISHQSVRIHINAGRRRFGENTHQRGNYTSELAKQHVDADFRSPQQIGQSAGFVVDSGI